MVIFISLNLLEWKNKIMHKEININNINIDESIVPLIEKFWSLGGISYECCQGGILEDFEPEDVDENNYQYYIKDNKVYERAWIIINVSSLLILISLLRISGIDDFHVIFGSNGYMISEYGYKDIEDNQICFVCWKDY